MFFRYIKDFFEYYFYRNKYRKQNYYINLLNRICHVYKNTTKNTSTQNVELKEWVDQFNSFEKIVVCASGPSLNDLTKFSDKFLYITTNSSVSKVLEHNFIYFTFTREYINMYLRHGLKQKGWQGTIFRFTKSKSEYKIRMNSYLAIKDYLSKFRRKKPELLLSNIQSYCIEEKNFNELNKFIYSNLSFDLDNENSGISILLLGYYFAKILNKPLDVYGLDAGSNGSQYFNNSGKPGKEISNKKTRISLTKILKGINNDNNITFQNYSNFKPVE